METKSRENCLASAVKLTTSAVYCPDDSFCGQSLDPGSTGELKFLNEKTCYVFLEALGSCDALQGSLDQAG